jgi:ParB/RepB/Spo0J family partition protein
VRAVGDLRRQNVSRVSHTRREINMPVLASKPLSWFKVAPQARRHFDEAELRQLGESLKVNQLQPVLARTDGTLIAGERRLRAASLVGLAHLLVVISDEEPLTESQLRIFQLTENLHRADLRDCEKWRACEELLRLNPTWSNKDLAAHLKLGESTVTKYLSPSRCVPEVQAALEAGQIGVTAAYEISRAPADLQAELLQLKLSVTSRDGLADRVRKQKNQSIPQVRVKRIACPLPSGANVVVSGEELSLDDLIEALGDAQKEARKAREQGLDAKTFSAVMKDKAKKGCSREHAATSSDGDRPGWRVRGRCPCRARRGERQAAGAAGGRGKCCLHGVSPLRERPQRLEARRHCEGHA